MSREKNVFMARSIHTIYGILFIGGLTVVGCSPGPATAPAGQRQPSTEKRIPKNPVEGTSQAASVEKPVQVNGRETGHQRLGIPGELLALFERIDSLGRQKVHDAKFVSLQLSNAGKPTRQGAETGWLISQDGESVSVLKDDLIQWTYQKDSPTTIPSSWQPAKVKLTSVVDADFESVCKELCRAEDEPVDEPKRLRRRFRDPGPSHRLLVAHAAWKRGLAKYCRPILSRDPLYKKDFQKYRSAVLEDLAWLHLLRAVNLLMYADRKDVISHLRLVSKLSPQGKYAAQAKDLLSHLERLIAEEKKFTETVDEMKLTDSARAEFYISQLKDIRCPQMAQPGFIMPYVAVVDGMPNLNPPPLRLKEMGMTAVPALIKALEDDTPTRTVYHWRDFAQSRLVWRVSDFAWNLLRDITKKEFGYRRVVGFTLGSMKPKEKRQVIEDIEKWYAVSKHLSPDDRMFAFFTSPKPEDWITAGKYFLERKDRCAVAPLLERIPKARSFTKGDLCELVAKFGDPRAKQVIQQVLESASEHSDRLSAAISLWTLGDNSGIPIVVKYVKATEQPYGNWDEPIWFLMRSRSEKGMEALESIVKEAPAQKAGEIIQHILSSITGDLSGEEREPAGCVEVCPVLVAAMGRDEYTGGSINDIKIRVKDSAAKAFVLLKEGTDDPYGGRFARVDPKVFNELELDENKRDEQIKALKDWHEKNKSRLIWDSQKNRLATRGD